MQPCNQTSIQSLMMELFVVLFQNVFSKIIFKISPYGMNMVCIILSIVILD